MSSFDSSSPFKLDDAFCYLQVSAINSFISFCSEHSYAPYVAILFNGIAIKFQPIPDTHDSDIKNIYPNPYYGNFKEK